MWSPLSGPSETGLGPAARRNFFRIIGQINDFFIEIDIISLRIVSSDGLDFNVSHGSCRIIKKESKIVEKVFLSVFLVTFFVFWWFSTLFHGFRCLFSKMLWDLDWFRTKLMIFRFKSRENNGIMSKNHQKITQKSSKTFSRQFFKIVGLN